MEAYKNLEKEFSTLQTSSADVERKAKQRISETKEAHELDRQAKAHMEDAFRLALEEKDEKISVMQMQVGQ